MGEHYTCRKESFVLNRMNYCGMRSRPLMMPRSAPCTGSPRPPCDTLSVVAEVLPQTLGETYGVEDAFVIGTLFPELNKPLGGGCCG